MMLNFSAGVLGKQMFVSRAEELGPCSKAGKNQLTFLRRKFCVVINYLCTYI